MITINLIIRVNVFFNSCNYTISASQNVVYFDITRIYTSKSHKRTNQDVSRYNKINRYYLLQTKNVSTMYILPFLAI